MNTFGVTSRNRLATCDLALQELFRAVVKVHDCSILEGHRSEARQAELLRQKKTQRTRSLHNESPSRAVDVAPYPIAWPDHETDPKKRAQKLSRFYFFAGIVLGIASERAIPIRWGGDWDGDRDLFDQQFFDLVHFELIDPEPGSR